MKKSKLLPKSKPFAVRSRRKERAREIKSGQLRRRESRRFDIDAHFSPFWWWHCEKSVVVVWDVRPAKDARRGAKIGGVLQTGEENEGERGVPGKFRLEARRGDWEANVQKRSEFASALSTEFDAERK